MIVIVKDNVIRERNGFEIVFELFSHFLVLTFIDFCIGFDGFAFQFKYDFIRHLNSFLKVKRMAEGGFDPEMFDPFAGLMPELEPIPYAGEGERRASQDVQNFESRSREVERIVIPGRTIRRRELRVGERIDLGHQSAAETAVFPLSEREKKEAPVEVNVIEEELTRSRSPSPTYVEDVAAAAPEVIVEETPRRGRGRPPAPPLRTSSPKNVEKIGVRTCKDIYGLVCSGLCLAANGIIFNKSVEDYSGCGAKAILGACVQNDEVS